MKIKTHKNNSQLSSMIFLLMSSNTATISTKVLLQTVMTNPKQDQKNNFNNGDSVLKESFFWSMEIDTFVMEAKILDSIAEAK